MASGLKTECLINGVPYKCRTCFDPGRTNYPLSNEASSSKTWLDLLKDIAQFQENDNELLPKTLCCKCLEKLKRAYEFVIQIHDVNKKYTELLAKEEGLNAIDNFTDCLAESAITLPLEQYMPDIKIEEELVVSYDVDMRGSNKLQADNEEIFENEDADDPFTETFEEDIKLTSAELDIQESTIAKTGESSTKRNRRNRGGKSADLFRNTVKRTRKSKDHKDIETSSQTDELANTDDNDEKKPIACGKCAETFFTIHSYQRHQQVEHSLETNERNKCPICSKEFRNKRYVVDHIKFVHDKIRPFKCSDCTKTFASAASKRIHELLHANEFPYPCEHCDKRFRIPSKLKVHSEIHTTKPELLCPICKRSQKSQEDLEIHVKNHDDNRLQCPSCGHLFRKRSNLDEHYNAVHLKLRPFKCEFCELWFGDRKSRRVHQRSRHK